MKNDTDFNHNYESPVIFIVEVHIEQGFAVSEGNEPVGNEPGE